MIQVVTSCSLIYAVRHLSLSSLQKLRGDTYVYLVSTRVLESTISATATIDKNCDERLDVERRFPSLVSYFVFHVADWYRNTTLNNIVL